jgi:hypothetical protein
MRGSYKWALFRLVMLAVFVIPAALSQPQESAAHGRSWLAAVDMAEPLVSLHTVMIGSPQDNTAVMTSAGASSAWQQFEQTAQRELKAAQLQLKEESARCNQQQQQLRNALLVRDAEPARSARPVRS